VRIHLVAVGERLPSWAAEAIADYRRRMPRGLVLEERAVASGALAGRSPEHCREEEARRLRAAIPARARRIVLDPRGEAWSSETLARRLAQWRMEGRPVALLIGGAEGLDEALRAEAEAAWSLGPMTLPHALVRVIVVEQLYRAAMMLANHPYHRG
jgi:23S rRNA (pseudouridine1915-N3)-methyltransferase